MKTAFFINGDFTYFAEIAEIEAIKDTFNLKITSQWLSAKNPEEEQTKLQISCTKYDIQKLTELLLDGINTLS
jgi:hypothetical protein